MASPISPTSISPSLSSSLVDLEKAAPVDLEKGPDLPQPTSSPSPPLEPHSTKPEDNTSAPLEPSLTSHTIQSAIERPQSLLHETAFVAILCTCQLMTQAGLGQAIAPLHIIGSSWGIQDQPAQLSWMPAAYSLTVGTFILPAGRLGDLYGHKRMVVIGYAWFALWSLLAGFSVYSTHVFFDICRAFQGMGPALLLPNAIAILGRAYEPGRRKSMAFSLFGATAPSGFVVGAVFASLLAEFQWWPWAFWVMGIMLALCAAVAWLVIPYTPPPVWDGKGAWKKTDALGAVTGVAGLVLINFAWNQAPVVGWQTPYVYVLLIVGSLFMGAFAYVEGTVAEFPLIPLKVMNRETGFVLACVSFGWAGFSVWVFYLWQFLQELRHVSPLRAAAQVSPTVISGLCAAITTGLIMSRVPGSVVLLIALAAFTTGLILLATAPVGQSYWAQTFVSLLIMPWGMDMSFPAGNLLLSNSMPKEHQGVSASLVNTAINYSISLALGFAGTIETHVNDGGRDLLRGYRGAWYLGIGISSAGMLIACWFGVHTWRRAREGNV